MRKGEAQYITIDIDPYYTLQSITSSDPNILEVKQDNAWNYIASAKGYGCAVIQATAVSQYGTTKSVECSVNVSYKWPIYTKPMVNSRESWGARAIVSNRLKSNCLRRSYP